MSESEILPAPEIELVASAPSSKWERERRAFLQMLPTLLPDHRGEYVAIHDEQVVGSGKDQFELAREAYRRNGYVPIYVGLVTDQPAAPLRVPSPRLLQTEMGPEVG